MVKKESTFPSGDGKTPIHVIWWLPENDPIAVLQISHGVAEYAARYEPFASYLTGRGFAVVANDHIGHGRSIAPGAQPLYLGPRGSWHLVVNDLYHLRGEIGKYFPGIPCFLLGHSMGSFLARTYLIRYPGTVDAAILMGTGQMSPVVTAAGRLIAVRESRKVGEDHASPVVTKLAFGNYNKPFAPNRTAYDWLSVNRENVDRYLADPLCGGSVSVGLFQEMLDGIDFIQKPENLEKMDRKMPVLFVSGSLDPVGGRGKCVRKAFRSFQKAGVLDVSMQLYPGARHEILNDDCRETVYRDLYAWLVAKVPEHEPAMA